MIHLDSLHTDPHQWSHFLAFQPDRFDTNLPEHYLTPESQQPRHTMAFLPYLRGKRQCLMAKDEGSNDFGVIALAMMLDKFRISLTRVKADEKVPKRIRANLENKVI